jgi:hypothetical protein
MDNEFFLEEDIENISTQEQTEQIEKTTEELEAEKVAQEAQEALEKENKEESTIETSEEGEVAEEETPLDIFANSLIEEGIVVPVEGKEYDASLDGIAELVKDTISQTIQQTIDENPQYANVLKAAQAGLALEEFIEKVYDRGVDYSTLDISDEDNQEILVRDLLERQGVKEKMIEGIIKNSKDDGTWEETVNEAHQALIEIQQNTAKEILEAQEKAIEDARLEADKALLELRKTVDSLEEIQGFKLDKKSKDTFYNYLTKPVTKEGKTKIQLDAEDKDKQLKMAWMYFTNFNEKDLVNKITTKANEKFEKALKSTKDTTLNKRSKADEPTEPTDDDIFAEWVQ